MTGQTPDLIEVPSGQTITLIDVILNAPGSEGVTARFRFLAPNITPDGDFDLAVADMQHLCDTYALPRVGDNVPKPQQIVISLSDRVVEFGEADADATQFFEAFSIDTGICVWEPY
jgi:hypothetical protein